MSEFMVVEINDIEGSPEALSTVRVLEEGLEGDILEGRRSISVACIARLCIRACNGLRVKTFMESG